jgi:5-methylcytosine-specific restriction endonuclease McrA
MGMVKEYTMRTKKLTRSKSSVLVLNKAYMPIDVWTWEDAMCAWFTDRAEILAEYDDVTVRTGRGSDNKVREFKVPAVIRLPSAFVKKQRGGYVTTLPATRSNLLKRDEGKCCYCGKHLTLNTATIEHVHPQSKGGLTDWMNCRMACQPCNHKKGDRSLKEMGWKLRKQVSIPTLNEHAPKNVIQKVGGKAIHPSWSDYIKWQVNWGD